MKKIFKYKVILLFVAIIAFFTSVLKAQDGNTIYFMQSIPQSNYSNPAMIPNCKFYIGLPISSIKTNFDNGSLSYNSVFTRRADDSLIIDKDKLLGSLSDNNQFALDLSEQIFAFGFRAERAFISFAINTKVSSNFNYTKDFMTFLLKGNEPFIGKNANLGDSKLGLNAYTEIAFGYTREFWKKFTFGVRVKYLIGAVNIYTEKSKINLFTDPNTYDLTATSDILVHSSSPFDSLNNFDGQMENLAKSKSIKNLMKKNGGYAFDFGGEYRMNKRLSFGVSVIDWGSINWENNVKDYKTKNPNAQFTFSGLDINEAFKGGELNDTVIDNLVDSLKEKMGIGDYTGVNYNAPLKTKLYLSAAFSLTRNDKIGVLMRNDFYNQTVSTSLSVSYNRNFGKYFAITISNTFVDGNMINPGGGFSMNIGPLQTYIIGDHFSSLYAADMTNFGLHFGINLVFGKTKPGYRYENQKKIEFEEERTKKRMIAPPIALDTIIPVSLIPVDTIIPSVIDSNLPKIDTLIDMNKTVDTTEVIIKSDTIVPIITPVLDTIKKVEIIETTPPIIKKEEIIQTKPIAKPNQKKQDAVTPKKINATQQPKVVKPKPTIKPVVK